MIKVVTGPPEVRQNNSLPKRERKHRDERDLLHDRTFRRLIIGNDHTEVVYNNRNIDFREDV
jgi:hypothetical protein